MRIQIFFLHDNTWLGRLIQSRTQSPYYHTGYLIDDINVWDTDSKRNFSLRYLPWSKKDIEIVDLNLTYVHKRKLIKWLQEHNGTKYDMIENIRWLLGLNSNSDAKYNCVESVINGLCECGYLSKIHKKMNLSPGELYQLLKG